MEKTTFIVKYYNKALDFDGEMEFDYVDDAREQAKSMYNLIEIENIKLYEVRELKI